MHLRIRFAPSLASILAAIAGSFGLAGCGSGAFSTGTEGNFTSAPGAIHGSAMGGQQPVTGAVVTFYATQPNGVAANGTYVGTATVLGAWIAR